MDQILQGETQWLGFAVSRTRGITKVIAEGTLEEVQEAIEKSNFSKHPDADVRLIPFEETTETLFAEDRHGAIILANPILSGDSLARLVCEVFGLDESRATRRPSRRKGAGHQQQPQGKVSGARR